MDESDDFKDGNDQEDWFRVERELTVRDVPFSIENDVVTVCIAIEHHSGSTLVISISARSVLILRVADDTSGHSDGIDHDVLRFVSLPLQVDPVQVTCALDRGVLTLKLPLSPSNAAFEIEQPKLSGKTLMA